MFNIIYNPGICSGAPTIKGRRLTVFNVVTKIYYEENLDIALEDYEISFQEAQDAVNYCSNLICQKDNKLIKFCSGCVLRTLQDGWNFKPNEYSEISCDEKNNVVTVSKDGQSIFLGSLKELEDNEFGTLGWVMASDVKNKYPVLGSDNSNG